MMCANMQEHVRKCGCEYHPKMEELVVALHKWRKVVRKKILVKDPNHTCAACQDIDKYFEHTKNYLCLVIMSVRVKGNCRRGRNMWCPINRMLNGLISPHVSSASTSYCTLLSASVQSLLAFQASIVLSADH